MNRDENSKAQNPNPMKKYIYRKEIAVLAEVSPKSVASNEKGWGIAEFRADANTRLVRYHRAETLSRLREKNIIPKI